jgi:hypothetical protein
MKFPEGIKAFGDKSFRGKCLLETDEQKTFVRYVRRRYPKTYGALIFHVKNEGKRNPRQARWQKSEGMTKGASDIIIPAGVSFVCEFKRKDHTQSSISDDQIKYLTAAQDMGAFACIALGYDGALLAFESYLQKIK